MTRKRVEAWAEMVNGELAAVHSERKVAESWASSDALVYGKTRIVRLVEYEPRREAVVRAAIQWTHLALDRSTTGSPGRADAYDALLRAVKRLEGGKK